MTTTASTATGIICIQPGLVAYTTGYVLALRRALQELVHDILCPAELVSIDQDLSAWCSDREGGIAIGTPRSYQSLCLSMVGLPVVLMSNGRSLPDTSVLLGRLDEDMAIGGQPDQYRPPPVGECPPETVSRVQFGDGQVTVNGDTYALSPPIDLCYNQSLVPSPTTTTTTSTTLPPGTSLPETASSSSLSGVGVVSIVVVLVLVVLGSAYAALRKKRPRNALSIHPPNPAFAAGAASATRYATAPDLPESPRAALRIPNEWGDTTTDAFGIRGQGASYINPTYERGVPQEAAWAGSTRKNRDRVVMPTAGFRNLVPMASADAVMEGFSPARKAPVVSGGATPERPTGVPNFEDGPVVALGDLVLASEVDSEEHGTSLADFSRGWGFPRPGERGQ